VWRAIKLSFSSYCKKFCLDYSAKKIKSLLSLMVNLLKARIFFKILPCLLHAVMKRQIPICCSMQAMQHTTIIKKNLIWTVDMDVVALSVYVHKVEVQNVNFKLSLELAYISGTWQLIIWQYHLDPRRRRLSCPAWLRYRVLTQNAERFLKRRTM